MHESGFYPKQTAKKQSVIQQMKLSSSIEKSVKRVHFDGFDHLYKAQKSFAKLFWAVLLVFSLVCVFYEICQLISRHHHIPIITTISTRLTSGMTLPVVEICSPALVSKRYLDASPGAVSAAAAFSRSMMAASPLQMYGLLKPPTRTVPQTPIESWEWFQSVFPEESQPSFSQLLQMYNSSETAARVDLRNMSQVYDEFMSMGFKKKDVFIACMFHNKENGFNRLDCEQMVREIFNPNFGKCFLILTTHLKQTFAGKGLMLVIDSQVSNYPTDPLLRPKTAGLIIRLHRHYRYSPYIFDEVHVQPGMFHKIILHPERHEYISSEGNAPLVKIRSCTSGQDMPLQFFLLNYSASSCMVDLLQKAVIDRCHCYLAEDAGLVRPEIRATSQMCSLFDVNDCVVPSIKQNGQLQKDILCSFRRCPPCCTLWKYHPLVNTMDLHRPYVESFFEHNASRSSSPYTPPSPSSLDDVIILHVAFEELRYMSLDQNWATDIHGLISDLGGQVSLWIGGCMVTIIQLMIVLCIAFVSYMVRILKSMKTNSGKVSLSAYL